MGLSITTTIFLFIVCLCGGIVIGAMFGRMKKASPDAPPEEPTEGSTKESTEEPPETPVDQEQVIEAPAATPKSLARAGETEILRAWRDEADKIWVEMDEQRLEAVDDLTPEQQKRLLKLVLDLRPWLETIPAPTPKPQVQEAPPPGAPTQRPSLFAPRAPKVENKGVVAVEKPVVNLKSIVEQIDDVLQEKLIETAFADLKIRLLEGPGGEVMVQIGSMRHTGVDAIPNPEIQALIHEAVAEWEKRSR
jgi:hypothetical protein